MAAPARGFPRGASHPARPTGAARLIINTLMSGFRVQAGPRRQAHGALRAPLKP